MSFADRRGLRPKTRLNGERWSIVLEGVMFIAKAISVSKHSGADGLEDRILSSTVKVLCCDSQRPLVWGWFYFDESASTDTLSWRPPWIPFHGLTRWFREPHVRESRGCKGWRWPPLRISFSAGRRRPTWCTGQPLWTHTCNREWWSTPVCTNRSRWRGMGWMTTEASAGCLTLTGVPLHVCTTQLFDLVPNGLSRALEMVPLPYRNVKNKLLKFSSITRFNC